MGCKGKVALVTGTAGQSMGRSIALTLAGEGGKVVVNYRQSAENAQAIVAQIERRGDSALAVQADVFSAADCKHLVGTAQEHFGQIDICVIGPGAGWHPEPLEQLIPELVLEDVHHELAPLVSLFPLVLPGMVERRWGRLIAIAMNPLRPSPAYAYNIGKASRIQALLLAQTPTWQHGLTANVVAPGPVQALASLENAVAQCDGGQAWTRRRNVSTQDIAEGVAFLCSEAGKFLTGCVLSYEFYA